MTIILIGYMGSGKSTIGEKLAQKLNFQYLDLDVYIANKEGKSISEIFEVKGEIYFRKIENQYLNDVISIKNVIISLGGGTPCYGNNMQNVKNADHVKSVYLKASIAQLVERLYNERTTRPLIAHLRTKDELTEFIGKHLFERSYYYTQADFSMTVDNKSVNAIVEALIMELF